MSLSRLPDWGAVLAVLFTMVAAPMRAATIVSSPTDKDGVTVPGKVDVAKAAGGSHFRECKECPEMIIVPSGRFKMRRESGAEGRDDFASDPKAPLKENEVMFYRSFAAGIYDVTRDEYAKFVRETRRVSRQGCYFWDGDQYSDDPKKSWHRPGFRQTARDPVVCVSWEDAQAYVRWLNGKVEASDPANISAGPYRLPTWQEAEYIAAGGASSPYYWGAKPDRSKANFGADTCFPCRAARQGADHWLYTSPAGSFPKNGFGVYDTAGDVWQWTNDCFVETGTEPVDTGCRWGILRGGSWLESPEYMQIFKYRANDRLNRNNNSGFRVVRSLGAEGEQ